MWGKSESFFFVFPFFNVTVGHGISSEAQYDNERCNCRYLFAFGSSGKFLFVFGRSLTRDTLRVTQRTSALVVQGASESAL